MAKEHDFLDFIRRIRRGDEAAAAELVRLYEPLIRREVRLHLENSQLSRSLDSVDVSQSVLASFFVRAVAGEYDVGEPQKLIRLLVKMARNKLASQARRQFCEKRDAHRIDFAGNMMESLPDQEESPSEHVSGQELLARFKARLTDEERQLCDMRSRELSWGEIVGELGGTANGRRMQLTRAIDRVSHELGLDD